MSKSDIKVGVRRGSGPPPGYQWSVLILDSAYAEAIDLLNEEQYAHLARQFKELATEQSPSHSVTASIDAIEDFHELRDKGGVLGRLNIRVFFGIDSNRRAIVVLGTINKKNDGPTPQGDKIRMRRRWRKYRNGEYAE